MAGAGYIFAGARNYIVNSTFRFWWRKTGRCCDKMSKVRTVVRSHAAVA
jgi:hypothetical protein